MTKATPANTGQIDHIRVVLEAIKDVSRFATRGCSGMSCDRVRVAWMGSRLRTIATHSAELPAQVRDENPELPWAELAALTDSTSGTPGGLTADQMQRFVERELPRFRKALAPLTRA